MTVFPLLAFLFFFCENSLGERSDKCDDENKTWLFHLVDNFRPHAYLERQKIRGFGLDLVSKVCQHAGKDCRVSVGSVKNCWVTKTGENARGGNALVSGFFDGCVSWRITQSRINVFSFTDPWTTTASHSSFYVKKGNPRRFNPTDIRKRTIGFLGGWYTDEHCLSQQDNIQGADKLTEKPKLIKHYPSELFLKLALRMGTIDAAFLPVKDPPDEDIQAIGDPVTNCASGGLAIMTRKDSCLNTWWKPAFQTFKESGEFEEMCRKALNRHGSDVKCLL